VPKPEEWIRSETLYKGRIITLRVGDVRLDDGVIAMREMVEHPGGVAVVPVLDDSVVLIRQYRIAIGQDILELPAGKMEGDEAPEHRGRRELEEETGYRAGRMVPVGSIFATVGYSSELIHLFLAFDLENVGQNLEFDERIDTVRIPLADIEDRIARNELKDAKTIVGLQALLSHLRQQNGAR
jgi:8-oxo-dGTP pyrophosphatase MutT (NUDIX family)